MALLTLFLYGRTLFFGRLCIFSNLNNIVKAVKFVYIFFLSVEFFLREKSLFSRNGQEMCEMSSNN
jgi:hypothetical protein